MNTDINDQIIEFLKDQKKSFSRTLFSTREIADAVGLTIYQARGCLDTLHLFGVVEKVNTGRGRPGRWGLL
ncbi:TPA: faeA-like family protein [Escherichia coli]|nr:faeA-like family protein [Escherichia coli]